MRVKIRKTHKKRYRIGKHDNVVGVLLKNKQTQRHIQSQHLKLRQSSIGEIRKYLYDHHLLKIGSNAPPDVLRRMYEDAILTGDVKNTNDGVSKSNPNRLKVIAMLIAITLIQLIKFLIILF